MLEYGETRAIRIHFENGSQVIVTTVRRRPVERVPRKRNAAIRKCAVAIVGEVLKHGVTRTIRVHLEYCPIGPIAAKKRCPVECATRKHQAYAWRRRVPCEASEVFKYGVTRAIRVDPEKRSPTATPTLTSSLSDLEKQFF